MGVTLMQDTSGAFPDRPISGGQGLRAVAGQGDGGAYVTVDIGQELSVMHVRCLVNVDDLSGGRAVLMIGTDGSDAESFRLTWDPASGQFRLTAGSAVVECEAMAGLAWHCLAWRINTVGDEVRFWRNGIEVASTPAAGGTGTRFIHAGLVMKDATAVGQVMIDEWVVADEYVGVVTGEPLSETADDPTRWLVVYNTEDSDSVAWAERYRQSHGLPYGNLCGLALSAQESIGLAECQAMVDAIEQFVAVNGLGEQIVGVLLGHRVPGVYTRGDGTLASVTDALQRRDGGETEVVNPLVTTEGMQRPTPANLNGDWLIARIDGPTLADSIALIDRAAAIAEANPIDPSASGLWIDFESGGGVFTAAEYRLRTWATGLDRQSTRLPMTTSDDAALPNGHIVGVEHDGFVWGFVDTEPPSDFFAAGAASRVLLNPMTDAVATGLTLRDAGDDGWVRRGLDAGYAAAAATVRPISPSALAVVEYLFEALRSGWSLGEAWHVASPLLRAGVVLIGDPLMVVHLPRAGWNVYGPFDSCADISWDQPLAMLRDDERSTPLPAESLPGPDQTAMFLVTRVDEHGRELRAFNPATMEGQS